MHKFPSTKWDFRCWWANSFGRGPVGEVWWMLTAAVSSQLAFLEANGSFLSSAEPTLCLMAAIFFSDKQTSGPIATLVVLSCLYIWSDGCCYLSADFIHCSCFVFWCPKLGAVLFWGEPILGDAEVEVLPDDLQLFSGYFWHILANYGYFLAMVWLIMANLSTSWLLSG